MQGAAAPGTGPPKDSQGHEPDAFELELDLLEPDELPAHFFLVDLAQPFGLPGFSKAPP